MRIEPQQGPHLNAPSDDLEPLSAAVTPTYSSIGVIALFLSWRGDYCKGYVPAWNWGGVWVYRLEIAQVSFETFGADPDGNALPC
jgi:hypothetical protein